jgi:lysozyme family protein
MTPAFRRAHAFTRRWEGGWSNDRLDPGGLTKWGVTLKLLVSLALDLNRDGRVDAADLEAMTEAEAEALYFREFWEAMRCADLPEPVALLVYEAAVNQGKTRAARFLQQAAGVPADGKVGPVTVAAARRAYSRGPRALLREIAARRALHYSGLSIFARFGLGWFRRLFDAAMTAEAMTAGARP